MDGRCPNSEILKISLALPRGFEPMFSPWEGFVNVHPRPYASIIVGNTIVSSEPYVYTCRYRTVVVYAHRRDTRGTLEAPTWRAAYEPHS